MNPIRNIRRLAAVLAGLAAALVAFATTPAFAMPVPPQGGGGSVVRPQHLAPVHAVTAGGMPGWQITLIAAAAAVLAATIAVLVDHRGRGTSASSTRGTQTVPAAHDASLAAPLTVGTAERPQDFLTGARRG
jgi:hypothetical protein